MKKYGIVMGVIAAVLFVALTYDVSYAQKPRAADVYTIHERIDSQQRRIATGINGGSLTRGEADILQDNLNHIRHRYDRAKADGVLTHREERKIQRMLDQNGAMINKLKRNMKVRRLY
ncbi:MAG: hypothetical protein AB9866_08055 [Syntrophobacteraceae bacterium]